MLHRLPGVFMRGLVVLFAVMDGSGTVSVCSKLVEFGSSLM